MRLAHAWTSMLATVAILFGMPTSLLAQDQTSGITKLQERSDPFVRPGEEIYEGMIVGENARDTDMVVNPQRTKKPTNIRAAGSDENILLKPPREMSLEAALEYIEDDEYVEITPKVIRLRKILLSEHQRRRARGA